MGKLVIVDCGLSVYEFSVFILLLVHLLYVYVINIYLSYLIEILIITTIFIVWQVKHLFSISTIEVLNGPVFFNGIPT
jgi:hypothetical protein